MGWVGEVNCRYLTHLALRAPLQWRGSAVAELTLNTYFFYWASTLHGLVVAEDWVGYFATDALNRNVTGCPFTPASLPDSPDSVARC